MYDRLHVRFAEWSGGTWRTSLSSSPMTPVTCSFCGMVRRHLEDISFLFAYDTGYMFIASSTESCSNRVFPRTTGYALECSNTDPERGREGTRDPPRGICLPRGTFFREYIFRTNPVKSILLPPPAWRGASPRSPRAREFNHITNPYCSTCTRSRW